MTTATKQVIICSSVDFRNVRQNDISRYVKLKRMIKGAEQELFELENKIISKLESGKKLEKGVFNIILGERDGQRRPKWAEHWESYLGKDYRIVDYIPCAKEIRQSTEKGASKKYITVVYRGEIVKL